VCDPQPPIGEQSSNPAGSCKAVYLDRLDRNTTVASGPQWIGGVGRVNAPAQVWCDMDTPTRDGLRGWTLCGKYDRDREAGNSRWLQWGFARAASSVGDMATLSTFSGERKWSSIDCRPVIAAGAAFFMHAGSDVPDSGNPFPDSTNVRFTNIMADVRESPENLFDTSFDDRGRCVARTSGGIITYNTTWEILQRDGQGDPGVTGSPPPVLQGLAQGACMVGDGHHFCTFEREGSRFSNAGAVSQTSNCGGSEADSIYWAWDDDQHGCNNALRIGTGCARRHTGGPAYGFGPDGAALPSFRYNFMLVH
jgi:hypothetical protein